ncbi:Aldolase-type TIM barrel [Phytophthora cactorum]|nr:Aldolase-type TIM barrel [Phytophthora cactorum]
MVLQVYRLTTARVGDVECSSPVWLTWPLNSLEHSAGAGPGLTLKNRMVFSPCTRARSDIKTRCPNDENVKYYADRASAGLIMSEGCALPLYTDEQQEGWRKIVEGVHAKVAPSFHPSNEVASCSSSCYSTGRTHDAEGNATGFPTTRAMTVEEVRQVIEDHRKCAERAKAAGFDGVEFHGAGGYLIDEFLQSSTNTRTDQYGGSIENRFRFLRELIEALTTVYPANRVGVRLSPNGVYGGMGSEDNYETFTYMGLCYLATHDGFGFGRSDKCRVFTVFELKTLFKGRVMVTCSYTRDQAEGVLHAGVADLVGFGRPFLRFRNDWPLVSRFQEDADKEKRRTL